MKDSFERKIDYLRLSLTDRCQLRCRYCMPAEGVEWTPAEQLLTFEEILTIIQTFADLGVKKLKLTGGEPLLHPDLAAFIRFAKEKAGIANVSLTTNGVTLARHLDSLLAAGLDGVNVSLDTLQQGKYALITHRNKFAEVMAGIEQAVVQPQLTVKINCVLMEEWNKDETIEITRLAQDQPIHVRFIEYMPIGSEKAYSAVPEEWIRQHLQKHFGELSAFAGSLGNGPAKYYQLPNFKGKIGFISPMTNHFCASCNRVRVTSDGFLKTCLFFNQGIDLKAAIKTGQLEKTILEELGRKPEKHLFLSQEALRKEAKNMVQIGG